MTAPNEELRKQLQQIYKSGELYYRAISDTTDLLQSQAERIATLEGDVEYLQKDINAMCNAIPDYRWSGGAAELIAECFAERDTLRAELADAELHTKQVERGLDKATAQLAAIAATEPSMIYHGRCIIDCGDSGHHDVTMLKMIARETKLFTNPMPAQRLTELKLLMLTTAYEQGVGKGIQRRDCNSYAADTDEHAAWKLGYEEGLGLRRI